MGGGKQPPNIYLFNKSKKKIQAEKDSGSRVITVERRARKKKKAEFRNWGQLKFSNVVKKKMEEQNKEKIKKKKKIQSLNC